MLGLNEVVKTQFFYRKDTFQIDAVFQNCETQSAIFHDPVVYVEVNVDDPPYSVTRNHKVILEKGKVVGTEPNVNPLQPKSEPREDLRKEIDELKTRLSEVEEGLRKHEGR